jgi:hypothetical protein
MVRAQQKHHARVDVAAKITNVVLVISTVAMVVSIIVMLRLSVESMQLLDTPTIRSTSVAGQ